MVRKQPSSLAAPPAAAATLFLLLLSVVSVRMPNRCYTVAFETRNHPERLCQRRRLPKRIQQHLKFQPSHSRCCKSILLLSMMVDPSSYNDKTRNSDDIMKDEASTDDNDSTTAATSSCSIGDVVQGLHGSKYQFQQYPNYEGLQFAESGYSSGKYQGDAVAVQTTMSQEPLPDWAIRWQQNFEVPKEGLGSARKLKVFSANVDSPITLTIRNDERSWEKFYTFVLMWEEEEGGGKRQSVDASYLIRVTPTLGMLAPRGKSGGGGEAGQTFSDTANLQVTATIEDPEASGKLWLLVGTEAERWVYKLV